MDSNEFWCKAFLAAMGGQYADNEDGGRWGNHGAPAAYCAAAADAATEVASKRGRLDGTTAPAERSASKAIEFRCVHIGDMWNLVSPDLDGGIMVHSEQLTYPLAGGIVAHITWSEVNGQSMPFKVRLERRDA